jgi:hypothetical protein
MRLAPIPMFSSGPKPEFYAGESSVPHMQQVIDACRLFSRSPGAPEWVCRRRNLLGDQAGFEPAKILLSLEAITQEA